MVGFCHLTDSHHHHHGQKPTMVGICHGGNMPVGHDCSCDNDDDDDGKHFNIRDKKLDHHVISVQDHDDDSDDDMMIVNKSLTKS